MPVQTFRAAGAVTLAVVLLSCAAEAAAQDSLAAAAAQAAQTATPASVRRLTMDEAVELALEQNLNLRVERINPRIQDEVVDQARAVWLPVIFGGGSYTNTDSPPDSFLSGSEETLKTDVFSASTGVQQALPWGGSYEVSFDGSRSTSNNIFNTFNPRVRSNLNLTYSQPLLRNRDIDGSRQQLLISRNNREISDFDLRAAVVSTIRNVRNAYVDLSFARANLRVQQQSLELAEQTLRDNRTRVEVGTMAPIDIIEAEAEVARNEENVIVAEAQIRQAEDRLRALVFDPATPEFWRLTIETTDAPPVVDAAEVDADAAIQAALGRRTDLLAARKSLESTEVNLRYLRNQLLPQVDLQVDYGTTGLAGTQTLREPGFPPGDVIGVVDRSFGDAVSDVFGLDYPAWTVGVRVSYPLGKNAAKTSLARTRLQHEQALLQLQNLELQVGTQIRDVVRTLQTAQKRLAATRAALALAEKRLEAEQKKFGVGMSTSFLVFQAQRDLAVARSNELQASVDYYKAKNDFEAVQETSIGGTSGIQVAGSAAASVPPTGQTTAQNR